MLFARAVVDLYSGFIETGKMSTARTHGRIRATLFSVEPHLVVPGAITLQPPRTLLCQPEAGPARVRGRTPGMNPNPSGDIQARDSYERRSNHMLSLNQC